MYCNETLRHVRVTIVAVEEQEVLHIVSVYSLRYPACSADAPYCIVVWPVRLYCFFPHYLTNDRILVKVTEHIRYVLIFSTDLSKSLFIRTRIQGDTVVNIQRS